MTEQFSLPLDASLPVPGLSFRADAISPAEEARLMAEIDRIDLPQFAFQQWTAKRRTKSFGYLYDFRHADFGPTEPIPDFLMPVRAIAADFAGVAVETLVQVSLIRYDPGAGIGWHRDRPELDAVIGFSLGAAAVMRFRRRRDTTFERASIALPPRSLYLLAGEVRYDWEHSIAPMDALRYSITFRGLAARKTTD